MAKPPAFQFYVSDFLTGTARFTAEEVGAYIRLLCYQWDCGGISEEDVPQLTGVLSEKLGRVLAKFSANGDGLLKNKRLEIVRKEQIAFRNKQKINGLKGGRPKNPSLSSGLSQTVTQNNPTGNPNKTSSSSPSSSTSSLSSSTTPKEKQPKSLATEKPSLFFMPLKESFLKVVSDKGLEYYFTSKDGANLKKIETKILFLFQKKSGNGSPTSKQVTDAWEYLLQTTKNKYVIENFTIPIINSKWNELVNEAKQAKNGTRDEKLKRVFDQLDKKIDDFYADKKD